MHYDIYEAVALEHGVTRIPRPLGTLTPTRYEPDLTDVCRNCGNEVAEPLVTEAGQPFCNAECRDDYAYEAEQQRWANSR